MYRQIILIPRTSGSMNRSGWIDSVGTGTHTLHVWNSGYRKQTQNLWAWGIIAGKGKGKFVPVHYAMTSCGWVDDQIHFLYTSSLVESEWSASGPCRFIPRKGPPVPDGPHSRSGRHGQVKIWTLLGLEPRSLGRPGRYIDYAAAALIIAAANGINVYLRMLLEIV
jgi:hypothetical protein